MTTCITEEAKLMSKVYTRWTIEDDKASAELFQNIFKFSNEVRKAAFDILTTYRGPYSMQVSASMLGMKREAAYALELLQRYSVEHEEKFEICEEIRDLTLELFRIILELFPKDCEIKYCPIDHARDMMRKWRTEHLAEPSKDSVCADEVSHVNLDDIAIPNTPTTSKRAVPAAPSSWPEQDNTNNKKMKSMASSQGRNSPLDDVRKFMDETEKVVQENYRKTQQFGEVDVGVVVKERDELKDEVEVLRNEVSALKQLQKSQADIMKARQQKWDDERDALKDEKKRLKCTMYDLFKAFDGLKENVKKIKALRDE